VSDPPSGSEALIAWSKRLDPSRLAAPIPGGAQTLAQSNPRRVLMLNAWLWHRSGVAVQFQPFLNTVRAFRQPIHRGLLTIDVFLRTQVIAARFDNGRFDATCALFLLGKSLACFGSQSLHVVAQRAQHLENQIFHIGGHRSPRWHRPGRAGTAKSPLPTQSLEHANPTWFNALPSVQVAD